MQDNYVIGFLGAGNMAGAIIGGIVESKILKPDQIAVCDVSAGKRASYQEKGIAALEDPKALVGICQYIVLSVKPQNFSEVLPLIKSAAKPDTVFISIAAGISIPFIKETLGYDAKVIRVMPNTPLLIGHGATALSRIAPVGEEEFAFAEKIFAAAGFVAEVPSDKMNEVIPLNGSSPAYIYLMAKVFVEEGIKAGFDADTANSLFCETLIGSAQMMMESGKSHQELIDMVTSPKGTTFEGLEALHAGGFENALRECFHATIRRAYELGK